MDKPIVRDGFVKAFFFFVVISIVWRTEAAALLFGVTGADYIFLEALEDLVTGLILVIGMLYIIEWLARQPLKAKAKEARPIVIKEANLMLDRESLAVYDREIKALLSSMSFKNMQSAGVSPIDDSKAMFDFDALYRTAKSHDLEKVRESCICAPDIKAQCYAFKRYNGTYVSECSPLEKVRESCICGADARALCFAFQDKAQRHSVMEITLDNMMAIVYEAITGNCWHERIIMERSNYPQMNSWTATCPKCLHSEGPQAHYTVRNKMKGPKLATSLDAWAEHIWPVIRSWNKQELSATKASKIQIWLDELERAVLGHTIEVATAPEVEAVIMATPLHHLEATLRVLDKWQPEMEQIIEEAKKQ